MSGGRAVDAALRRLGRQSWLAVPLLRLPRVLPEQARARLYRSYSWPLAKRLGMDAVVAVSGGARLRVSTTDQIGRVLAISGMWEPSVTAAFRQALRPGDVCVDIGAHVGYFSLLASRMVGPTGHVYAFEPSPRNFEALRANLERNRVVNVTPLPFAVGDHAERAILHEGPGTNTGRSTLRRVSPNQVAIPGEGVTVEVRPATAQIPPRDVRRIRVIKIDVEGYEIEALRGLEPLFERDDPLAVFVEINPGWEEEGDVVAFVDDVRRRYDFRLQRLSAGYRLETMFPSRVEAPVDIPVVPPHECDLLLTR